MTADLGTGRRKKITTTDFKEDIRAFVPTAEIQATRLGTGRREKITTTDFNENIRAFVLTAEI